MTRIEVGNPTGRRRSGGFGRGLLILLLVLAGGAALWTWLTVKWAYADGERSGILQKFVRRGWICKTREGEIALYYAGGQYMGPGSSPQLWDFSVIDAAVAQQLNEAVGHRVRLHYTEHPGVPTTCMAETRYFVDKVAVTDESAGTGTALPPSPAPPAPAASAAPAAKP